jgi:tetratricopeptide (TPR) repeat protein
LDKGLPPSAAVDLLRHLDHDGTVGLRSAAPEMLAAAADRVRGYPRALEALYAVLRNDRNTSLEELLGKADAALPEQVVQVMVGEAFSRLARHEQLIVTALAIFNRPVPAVALDYLLQPFAPAVESAPVLGWLVNLQMVRKDRDRYYLHQVDAEFARTGIPEAASPAVDDSGTTPLTRKALLVRAADYFREIRKPKAQWQSILDLEPQLAEFDLLCRAERYDDAALLLLAIGFDYLRSWGHISRLIESHERLRGRVQDEETESRCLGILGTAYWDAGYLAQAVADLRGSIALAERTQGENAAAAWWCDLGCCLRDLGRIEEAQAAHERALEVDHHFGDRSGVGSDLNNIAECYGDQGLTDLATRCIELGIEMIPLADVDDRRAIRMRGYRLATRAKFSLDARRWEQATESATEALRLGRQIGNSEVTARSSYYLALTSVSRGDLDAAKEAAKACIECEYPRLKFRALLLNGLIFLKLNEKREAEENFALCSRECAELLSRSEENYLARFHLALARCGLFVCGQTTDLQPAKDMLTGCTALKQYPGIRTRFLHLLRVMAAHDSTLELEDLALRIGGVAIGLPKPAAPVRSVLEHDAVRALRAALGPTRMSELHRHGFFEQCAEVAAGCEPVVNAMSVYQRREFLRARAWAQARRGFLDGAGFWTASKSGTTCHRCCG